MARRGEGGAEDKALSPPIRRTFIKTTYETSRFSLSLQSSQGENFLSLSMNFFFILRASVFLCRQVAFPVQKEQGGLSFSSLGMGRPYQSKRLFYFFSYLLFIFVSLFWFFVIMTRDNFCEVFLFFLSYSYWRLNQRENSFHGGCLQGSISRRSPLLLTLSTDGIWSLIYHSFIRHLISVFFFGQIYCSHLCSNSCILT